MRASKLDRWTFAVPLAIGATAFILLIAWFDASTACQGMPTSWPGGNRCALVKFLYDWQQLFGGLAAVGAAIAAWLAIDRQLQQAVQLEAERNRSKHDAARAMLPLALDSLIAYCHECAARLVKVQQSWPRNCESDYPAFSPPEISSESLQALRDMIEAMGRNEGHALANVVVTLQIHAARLNGVHLGLGNPEVEVVPEQNIIGSIADTARLHAQTSALFAFARGLSTEVSSHPPSDEKLATAVAELRIPHPLDTQVKAQLGLQ